MHVCMDSCRYIISYYYYNHYLKAPPIILLTVWQRIISKKICGCIQITPPKLQKQQVPGTAQEQILPLQTQQQTDTHVAAHFYGENIEYIIPEMFY